MKDNELSKIFNHKNDEEWFKSASLSEKIKNLENRCHEGVNFYHDDVWEISVCSISAKGKSFENAVDNFYKEYVLHDLRGYC